LNVTGGYQQIAGATLNLVLGGTTSGNFSRLAFSGSASLAGTLNITFMNCFVPALGDSFQILTASSVSGTFGTILAPTGFTLIGTYSPSNVTITETSSARKMFIVPSSGGDTGSVTAQISLPAPFTSGATVKLSRSGYPDIPGSNVTLGPCGLSLTATFNLTGQAHGAWDVVVTNANGSTATLLGGFTVNPGQAPKLWVNIIGRSFSRVYFSSVVKVSWGNSGKFDHRFS
jgi:hypothetical protein